MLGKNLQELQEVASSCGMPSYAAGQMARWLYKNKVRDIPAMTNLSKAAREKLGETWQVGGRDPVREEISSDGTKKHLFPAGPEEKTGVEAVLIPEEGRNTLCLSSQAGCKLGCAFCMTARMGFRGQLTAGEIVGQFLRIPETDLLTNVVYMGMGEPFDNWPEVKKSLEILTADWGMAWSPGRITVSTSGILPVLDDFMAGPRAHLAVSLHNPYDEERAQLMPVQKSFPISSVVRKLRTYDFKGQRRLSFEYILFDGWNDTQRHAAALLQLLRGLECRVNLIRFHAIPDFPMLPSGENAIQAFKDRLNRGGLVTTVRASRGQDILAACGMLSVHNTP